MGGEQEPGAVSQAAGKQAAPHPAPFPGVAAPVRKPRKLLGPVHFSMIIKGVKIETEAHVWLEGGRGRPAVVQASAVLNQNYHFDTGKLL